MRYRFEASFVYHRTEAHDPDLGEFLDRVDEHLIDKLGAQDVFIAAEAASSTFTIALTESSAADELAAAAKALATIRTAFHAEDCSTPDWPECSELLSFGMVKQQVEAQLQPA